MKKSELRNIVKESIRELIEGPNDCYHKYNIKTSNASHVGFYFGSPSSGASSFSCSLSNQLHSMLGFSSDPNKVVSIKNTSPTNPHGFINNNCISFMGTFQDASSPQMGINSPQHIATVLLGPAFGATVVTYNSIQECMEDYKFVDRDKTNKKRRKDNNQGF